MASTQGMPVSYRLNSRPFDQCEILVLVLIQNFDFEQVRCACVLSLQSSYFYTYLCCVAVLPFAFFFDRG